MDIQIREFGLGDLDFGLGLSGLAGWNQTEADWRRLVGYSPRGCFVAEYGGMLAGTVSTLCYGEDMAWIGMMLVHPDFRRKGIATALMKRALEYLLEEKGIRCVKLDATPEGLPVYGRLGFREELTLHRWSGWTMHGEELAGSGAELENLEIQVQGFGRELGGFLKELALSSLCVHQRKEGFGMIREGARKLFLGPVFAGNPATGREIVESLLAMQDKRPVYWDIPEGNVTAVNLAKELGFQVERKLVRMWFGEEIPGDPKVLWGICGPEMG